MPDDPVYAQIAEDSRDCLVLEVPLGVRTGTDRVGPGEALSFYQPTHQKRLINGFAARAPLAAMQYYRSSPALMTLAGEAPPPGDVAADLASRLDELRVGYVVVHAGMMSQEHLRGVLELLGRMKGLSCIERGPDVIAFRRDTVEPS
jgi:hypothetical protein